MKKLLKYIWVLVIVLVIVAGAVYKRFVPVEVEMADVTHGAVEEVVEEEARTQLHTERIVTTEQSGTVARVTLEVGDEVAKGQPITTVDDTDLRLLAQRSRASVEEIEGRLAGVDVPLPKPSEIARAEKSVQQAREQMEALKARKAAAQAELTLAKEELDRTRDLKTRDVTSLQAFQSAQRNHDVAVGNLQAAENELAAAGTAVQVAVLQVRVLQESMSDTAHLRKVYGAQLEQTRKEIELIDRQIQKSVVTSPVDGIVTEKYLDSEQYAQSGQPLVKVGVMDSIEIRADILSDEIGRVAVGQVVHLAGPAMRGRRVDGLVKKVYPAGFEKISSLGVRQQRVTVLVEFDNTQLGLRPESELDVEIVVDKADDAVLVPSAAVIAASQGQAVFVVREGEARLQPIEIGLRGKDTYQVTEGLVEGDRVIVRPPTDLQEGARVKSSEPDDNTN